MNTVINATKIVYNRDYFQPDFTHTLLCKNKNTSLAKNVWYCSFVAKKLLYG